MRVTGFQRKGGDRPHTSFFYKREPGYKRMIPFGTVAHIQRRKKNKRELDRSEPARVIGYPDDTPGWKFKVSGTRKPYVTSHARFDASRTVEDRALARSTKMDNGLVQETQGTDGIPLGNPDSDIRQAVKRYQTEIIRCSQPSEGALYPAVQTRSKRVQTLSNSHTGEATRS